eukprot:GHVT01008570.1.p1 GENE.GHVT01008570.1~~GHVT01008570.1.p1  ORF type:complete len:1159 (-),score=251.27 GHVT01008570.1:320-3796(-)
MTRMARERGPDGGDGPRPDGSWAVAPVANQQAGRHDLNEICRNFDAEGTTAAKPTALCEGGAEILPQPQAIHPPAATPETQSNTGSNAPRTDGGCRVFPILNVPDESLGEAAEPGSGRVLSSSSVSCGSRLDSANRDGLLSSTCLASTMRSSSPQSHASSAGAVLICASCQDWLIDVKAWLAAATCRPSLPLPPLPAFPSNRPATFPPVAGRLPSSSPDGSASSPTSAASTNGSRIASPIAASSIDRPLPCVASACPDASTASSNLPAAAPLPYPTVHSSVSCSGASMPAACRLCRLFAFLGKALQGGGLVSFPTETVYGLGASGFHLKGVLRIFEAKQRPLTDPLILHVPSVWSAISLFFPEESIGLKPPHNPAATCGRTLDESCATPLQSHCDKVESFETECAYSSACGVRRFDEDARERFERLRIFRHLGLCFWPGPLSIVEKARCASIPLEVTAFTGWASVRCPCHPVALRLLTSSGVPVAAPSANRFGRISPTAAAHVQGDLFDAPVEILDAGTCPVGLESTVVKIEAVRPNGSPPASLPKATAAALPPANPLQLLPQHPGQNAKSGFSRPTDHLQDNSEASDSLEGGGKPSRGFRLCILRRGAICIDAFRRSLLLPAQDGLGPLPVVSVYESPRIQFDCGAGAGGAPLGEAQALDGAPLAAAAAAAVPADAAETQRQPGLRQDDASHSAAIIADRRALTQATSTVQFDLTGAPLSDLASRKLEAVDSSRMKLPSRVAPLRSALPSQGPPPEGKQSAATPRESKSSKASHAQEGGEASCCRHSCPSPAGCPPHAEDPQPSPGMRLKHYSPMAPTFLVRKAHVLESPAAPSSGRCRPHDQSAGEETKREGQALTQPQGGGGEGGGGEAGKVIERKQVIAQRGDIPIWGFRSITSLPFSTICSSSVPAPFSLSSSSPSLVPSGLPCASSSCCSDASLFYAWASECILIDFGGRFRGERSQFFGYFELAANETEEEIARAGSRVFDVLHQAEDAAKIRGPAVYRLSPKTQRPSSSVRAAAEHSEAGLCVATPTEDGANLSYSGCVSTGARVGPPALVESFEDFSSLNSSNSSSFVPATSASATSSPSTSASSSSAAVSAAPPSPPRPCGDSYRPILLAHFDPRPLGGLALAVFDRLYRAAEGKVIFAGGGNSAPLG